MSLDDVQGFISRLLMLTPHAPSEALDEVLLPCIEADKRLRELFAQNRGDPRLSNMYIGTVNVFQLPPTLRITRVRGIEATPFWPAPIDCKMPAQYLLPLETWNGTLRRSNGEPCMVPTVNHFYDNFQAFSMGVLRKLDWNNVVVAGGSVLACLTPIPHNVPAGQYFHNSDELTNSDIDIFLYGLNENEARAKLLTIYQSIRDELYFKVLCIRKANTITIISQYPFRHVQIILRLYHSPAEILAGFDIDAACVLYNGREVFAAPRAITAMIRQCNMIDLTRRSPSYEYRLLKYRNRGFEVRYPQLRRDHIRDSLYDPELSSLPNGLARLLVFEFGHRYKNFSGPALHLLAGSQNSLRISDISTSVDALGAKSWYDSSIIRIPYGPRWNANSVKRLLQSLARVDFLSRFDKEGMETVPEELVGHHHCIFWGPMRACLKIICPNCPATRTNPRHEYGFGMGEGVQGPLRFIESNPGRQLMTGSFHPMDLHEWDGEAYMQYRDDDMPFTDAYPWPFNT